MQNKNMKNQFASLGTICTPRDTLVEKTVRALTGVTFAVTSSCERDNSLRLSGFPDGARAPRGLACLMRAPGNASPTGIPRLAWPLFNCAGCARKVPCALRSIIKHSPRAPEPLPRPVASSGGYKGGYSQCTHIHDPPCNKLYRY